MDRSDRAPFVVADIPRNADVEASMMGIDVLRRQADIMHKLLQRFRGAQRIDACAPGMLARR